LNLVDSQTVIFGKDKSEKRECIKQLTKAGENLKFKSHTSNRKFPTPVPNKLNTQLCIFVFPWKVNPPASRKYHKLVGALFGFPAASADGAGRFERSPIGPAFVATIVVAV
jgi:hypothetical protein